MLADIPVTSRGRFRIVRRLHSGREPVAVTLDGVLAGKTVRATYRVERASCDADTARIVTRVRRVTSH